MKHEPWSLGASLPGAVTKNGIEWVTLPFRALDAAVLYRVLALRSSIFVVEQECLYQDIDGLDQHALIVVGILLLIVLILALVGVSSLKSAQAHRPDPAASVAATKEAIEKGLGK